VPAPPPADRGSSCWRRSVPGGVADVAGAGRPGRLATPAAVRHRPAASRPPGQPRRASSTGQRRVTRLQRVWRRCGDAAAAGELDGPRPRGEEGADRTEWPVPLPCDHNFNGYSGTDRDSCYHAREHVNRGGHTELPAGVAPASPRMAGLEPGLSQRLAAWAEAPKAGGEPQRSREASRYRSRNALGRLSGKTGQYPRPRGTHERPGPGEGGNRPAPAPQVA